MCCTPLFAMEKKQEDWFIPVLYASSPSDFHAATVKEGALNKQSEPLKFSATQAKRFHKSKIGTGGRRCTVEPLD